MSPLIAAGLSAVAAIAARLAQTLTPAGATAAWVVGTLVLTGTGWAGGAVLAAFFVSSSLVSRLVRTDTASRPDATGDCRDHRQVVANGGTAAAAALVGLYDSTLGLWLVTASLAAAGADTWATAWGVRSPTPPRHLLSGRTVALGTSGGVSPIGTAGGAAGAGLVAAVAVAVGLPPAFAPAALLIGFAGMLTDSVLGAAFQGEFHCPACATPSERPVHDCGTPTRWQGGTRWLTNDGVNGLTTALATLAGAVVWAWRCPCS